jgi:hypothetical protein
VNLRRVALHRDVARAFVSRVHRHHDAPTGHRFSVGCMDDARGGVLCGVAMVGRPVARALDEWRIVEVNRLATDGTKNACSFLYGAAARAAQAMGFFAIITYTLEEEHGASLRASGWWEERGAVEARPNGWDCEARPREQDPQLLQGKTRWLKLLNEWGPAPEEPVEEESSQLSLLA